jgi:imidazolonepropionase-like amidohydrolase
MIRFFVCLILALVAGVTYAQNAATTTILLRAGKFYDAEKNQFLKNQDILIENNKIKAVGTKLTVPKGAQVIDLPNATVTPGLIDAHTHLLMLQRIEDNLATDALLNSPERRVLRAASYARSYLESGFTAIRDLGNSGQYLDVEVTVAIHRGYIPGPRMYVSGPILSAMDGQFYQLPFKDYDRITQSEYRVIKNAEDAALAVKEHANKNVHVIKIVAFGERLGLEADELAAIVKAAHAHRLPVTAHAISDGVVRKAVDAGVDGIEHGYYISDSTLELMARKGIYLVPTDPSIQSMIDVEEAQHIKEHNTATIQKTLQPLTDRLKRAMQKGVMIVAGSDAYFDLKGSRGDAAKQTLAAYVEEGLSAAEVLRTATYNAAIALGKKNELGVIREGAQADIAIFNGDLENDFKKVLFDVNLVMKDGKIVYRK